MTPASPAPLPCPWCGEPAEVGPPGLTSTYVGCSNGECESFGPWAETEVEAIATWNLVASLSSDRDALRALLREAADLMLDHDAFPVCQSEAVLPLLTRIDSAIQGALLRRLRAQENAIIRHARRVLRERAKKARRSK